jgi:anaerobic ribonucleoside-triphosphate reductase activating protein
MAQARALAELVQEARRIREIDVICFTGYRLQDLVRFTDPGIHCLLRSVDVLIDGPYIQALNTGVGLRGSENQGIHYLTERLAWFDFEHCPRDLELHIIDKAVQVAGIPSQGSGAALASLFGSIGAEARP